jgi:hypothetical protein
MKMLLVCSLFTLALATPPTVTTDGSCTAADDHPENGGYHVVGVKGYKEITADGDKDDSTPYGEFGQLADDTLWSSEASYPNGGQSLCAKGKDLRQGRYGPYEYECRNDMEHHNWRTVHTCSIMRFSFPSSSDSTVYKMTSNESMWACDFSDAVQITDGGELASGASFVDYVFEDDSLDKKYFFASLKGCEQGQRIAVAVAAPYGTTYDAAFKEGTMTKRIQHCDCDFGLDTGMEDNEVAHTGFVDGCMSEMPSNLDCCPGEDVELVKGGHSNSYKNGGNCMRKSDEPKMVAFARELYKKCADEANKDECETYKTGQCPYWRVYRGAGYVYNSMDDGEEGCACSAEDQAADSAKPHCRKSVEYGPASGYLHHSDCSKCGAHGTTYLSYNGRGNRMPDINENYGCDGANTTYNEQCDMWYEYTNCKDLEAGTLGEGLTSTQVNPTLEEMLEMEITAATCAGSQRVAAMNMYLASPEFEADFATTTADPVADTDSNCRIEATAALIVWLISVLQ